MSSTEFCDVFASLSEDVFNTIIRHVRRQRPSLFSLGTATFAAQPAFMCRPVETAPGLPDDQPRVALQPLLPVPGTAGEWGLEFCAQLTDLSFDLHPGTEFTLPPELQPPLKEQRLALRVEVCAAIACPSRDQVNRLALLPVEGAAPAVFATHAKNRQPSRPAEPKPLPVDAGSLACFCLELFGVCRFNEVVDAGGRRLMLVLERLELQDLAPPGLEGSVECLLDAMVRLGILPRLRIAIDDLIFSLGEYGAMAARLTPSSADVPFNPSVAGDRLSVFVDLDLI